MGWWFFLLLCRPSRVWLGAAGPLPGRSCAGPTGGTSTGKDGPAPGKDKTDGPPAPGLTGPHRPSHRSTPAALAPPAGSGPAAAPPHRERPGNSRAPAGSCALSSWSRREGRVEVLPGAPARSWQGTVSRGRQLCSVPPSSAQSEGQKLKADAEPLMRVQYRSPEHKPRHRELTQVALLLQNGPVCLVPRMGVPSGTVSSGTTSEPPGLGSSSSTALKGFWRG